LSDHLLGEAALADPGLAAEEAEPSPAGERILERGGELGQLGLAADERAPCRLGRRFDGR
jgi:hypothetical protein